MPDPSPAERREPRPLQSCISLLEGMARTAGDFGLAYIDKTQALDLAAAVRDLADENERLRGVATGAIPHRYERLMGVYEPAAAERDALREQVERLRPFAEKVANMNVAWYPTSATKAAARAALSEEPQP